MVYFSAESFLLLSVRGDATIYVTIVSNMQN